MAAHAARRVLSDGPIAMLVLVVLGQVPPTGQHVLRVAGGVLLLYLAWVAFRDTPAEAGAAPARSRPAPRTLLQAALVNLLNPNPYLGWALVLGPAVIAGWRQGPVHAVAVVVAFYGVLVAGLAGVIIVASGARLLPARAQRALALVSAIVLAMLGAYQLTVGLHALARG
jgi:threonine/homoserine/homoserine lactone efflux protein